MVTQSYKFCGGSTGPKLQSFGFGLGPSPPRPSSTQTHLHSSSLNALMKRSQSFQSFLQVNRPSSSSDQKDGPLDFNFSQDSILSPPFYGRPYRLPPSPSFTELLKPQWHYSSSFSRAQSRDGPVSGATTPESSDDESTIAKASEFAQHQTGNTDVGAVGTNEFYGFALYLGSSIAFCISNEFIWLM